MNKQACQKWIEKRESGDCCVKKRKNKKVSEKITAFSSKFRTIRREYSNDADLTL